MSYFGENYRHFRLPVTPLCEPGFRPAQIAALYALGSHFYSNSTPGIIVMPTGSGKSAVLTAAPFVLHAKRVLVLTPSRLVREQLAENFQSLVDLRKLEAIDRAAPSPNVATVANYLRTDTSWEALEAFDVVVATVPSVSPRAGFVATPPRSLFDLVLVDEAHHSSARTWATLLRELSACRQVLFTATPYRRDEKEIAGKIVFQYEMKRARDDGVFGEIRYQPVACEADETPDVAIARAVAARFNDDRRAALRHLVMVRADTLNRAKELHALYEQHTSLRLEFVKGSYSLKRVKRVIQKLESNELDGVVCVNMFGEGFNLPRLKIAGIHSPHKSLAVTLQFIGRFARAGQGIGAATFLAEPHQSTEELGNLYESGSTWRELVVNLGDSRIAEELVTSQMLDSFNIARKSPELEDFSLYSLWPYTHVKVYAVRDAVDLSIAPGFPEDMTVIYSGLSTPHNAAVYLTRTLSTPRWSADDRFLEVQYDIFVFHCNVARKLLFVCASIRRESLYRRLVEPLTGGAHSPLSSNSVNRVLRDLKGLRVFNLGFRTRNPLGRTESYQQRSGSDVARNVMEADGRRFDRGHLYAGAIDGAQSVTIGVSTSSKVWQNAYLRIPDILRLCDRYAEKIANRAPFLTSTGLDFLSAGEELDSVPDELIFAVWSYETYEEHPIVFHADSDGVLVRRELLDLQLEVLDSRPGYCDFGIFSEGMNWRGRFTITDGPGITQLDANETDVFVEVGGEEIPLADYLTDVPPTFYRGDLSRVEGRSLFPSRAGVLPFGLEGIESIDWGAAKVNIESEKISDARGRSIFSWVEERVHSLGDTFVFCDDGPGEVADYISVNFGQPSPIIRFFHCKASSRPDAGSRQRDFYDVTCQALRTSPWFNLGHLLDQIQHRRKTNVPGILHGTEADLRKLADPGMAIRVKFQLFIVQPGLNRTDVSSQILELLGGISAWLRDAGLDYFGVISS